MSSSDVPAAAPSAAAPRVLFVYFTYLGVKIPPSNLKPDYGEQARAFANEVADGLERRSSERVSASSARAPDGQTRTP